MLLTVVGDILDSDIYVHTLELAGNLRKEHRIYRAHAALPRFHGKVRQTGRAVDLGRKIEGPDIHPGRILEVQHALIAADQRPFHQTPVLQPYLGIGITESSQNGETLERLYGEIRLPGVGVRRAVQTVDAYRTPVIFLVR